MATLSTSKKVPQRLWRPDFRNTQTLPDTKVIRTGFLLNFVGLSLAVGCMTLYGFREYALQNLIKEVKSLESQVAEATAENRRIMDSNKKFRENADIVAEEVAFDNQAISYHEFLGQLAESLQEGMQLGAVTMENSGDEPGKSGMPPFHIELTGKVLEDAPATPAQVLSNFQSALKELPCLQEEDLQMEMTRFSRNNKFGYFDFTLLIKIAVEKAPSL
ncbi:MAG: hypothetical protein ACO3ZW_06775 [Opitutales bacterium]|jgi:hypothetical protein